MDANTSPSETTVPRHIPDTLSPVDVARQRVRALRSQRDRDGLAVREASLRAQYGSESDRADLARAEGRFNDTEIQLQEAEQEAREAGRAAAVEREARERSERAQRLAQYITTLSLDRTPAAVEALERARAEHAQAVTALDTLKRRAGELRDRAARQDRDLQQAAREYAAALVRGDADPQPPPAKVDYEPTLKLLQVELGRAEQRVKDADAAVQRAEHDLQLARASAVYARVYSALRELIDTLPAGLPMPDEWSRIIAIQPNTERVVITIAREPKL